MNVRQGRKLEEYKSQLSDEISNKYTMLNNDLQGIASRVEHTLEEGAKLDLGVLPVLPSVSSVLPHHVPKTSSCPEGCRNRALGCQMCQGPGGH